MGNLGTLFYRTLWILSGEFLLQWPSRRANGGTLIFLRSLFVNSIVYGAGLLLYETLDPTKQWRFSLKALQIVIHSTLPWFAAVFGAMYAALYARFSSQWTYLASLYNPIKVTEAQADTPQRNDVVRSMKAGFIEDAEELHLALKQTYAALIRHWVSDQMVRNDYEASVTGGTFRLKRLISDVDKSIAEYEKYFRRKALKTKGRNSRAEKLEENSSA